MVEEHLAVQQMVIDLKDRSELSDATCDRLMKAFIAAAEALKRHTLPLAETSAARDAERGEAS